METTNGSALKMKNKQQFFSLHLAVTVGFRLFIEHCCGSVLSLSLEFKFGNRKHT